jgi:hsp70-interacting protein
MDPKLNELLKWGVENSSTSLADPDAPRQASTLDPALLASLLGGPSDADLMKASMEAILSDDPEISLDDKIIAFDNFEQLIENLDNANNLAPLALWTPLIDLLSHKEAEIRKMAAWCVGTAVQNNEKSQEKCLAMGGVPSLVDLATKKGEQSDVRRKAVYALSSQCRNFQPAMDAFVEELGKQGIVVGQTDASDMDAIDKIIGQLREDASKA